jgi:magnesium-protoporphyrin IX monomethyl ester (oxidative) cyclase
MDNKPIKINRILLIAPPAITFKKRRDINPVPPLGLGYLASVAEKTGAEVKILDCLMQGWFKEESLGGNIIRVGLPKEEILEVVDTFKPDLIGISCQFSMQYREYHDLFSYFKQHYPAILIVAGGAHVTVCADEVIKDPACDYVMIGEAEESFKDLIFALRTGKGIEQIDGLGYKVKGRPVINRKTRYIEALDSIPFPAYHLMDLEKYFGLKASHGLRHKERFCSIITSRGCTSKCSFCSAKAVWGEKYRLRSVDGVIEEMKLLRNTYNIDEIIFEDDNLTANPKRARDIFSRMIEEELNFIWDTPNGVGAWTLDEELVDLMKGSGCIKLNFPVESGCQRVLNSIIRKPLNLSKVRKLIKHCKRIKLNYGMFLVIGLPGEQLSEMWESIVFSASNGVYDPHISVATPYPGTDLFEVCKKNNLFSRKYSFDDLFLRSFMIKTKDWDGTDISRVLFRAKFYLKIRQFFSNPIKFSGLVVSKLKKYVTLSVCGKLE